MSSSKNKPKEPKIKYDFTEQIKRNNPSYKYDVKSIILNTMGKKKIKKKSDGGDIKVKKIDPLSERLDKAGLRGGAGRYKGLTKKDKKVVDAFYSGKKADSNLLTSTGKTLQKEGMGSQKIATRTKDDGFKITAKMDSKSTQSIVNYINKSFPKDTIKKTVKKKNKGGLLVTPKLAQRGF